MHQGKSFIPVLACALALSACAAEVAPPAAPTIKQQTAATEKGGIRHQAVTIRATVSKIEQKTRHVTLVGFDGTRETVTVGPDVKNLAQVKKGDEVVVTYYQALAFDVLGKGETRPEASAGAGLATAEPGDMPGGIAARTMTVVVDVLKLDPGKSTATIRLADGTTKTVDIKNPAVFEKVKVGDKVEVRMIEAMAVDVQKPSDK